MKKTKISDYIWLLIAVGAAILRIGMMMRTPIYALANYKHDDLLLVTLAQHLQEGEWLGPYNNLTLVKGISFPVFLALCNRFCIPYLFGMGLFYTGAVILFVTAVREQISNRWVQLGIYLFLLYSPAMLSVDAQQRVYNCALVPGAILLVFAGVLGVFFRRHRSWKTVLVWSCFLGFAFPFFWHLRNDTMWMLPFVLTGTGISIFCIIKKNGFHKGTAVKSLICLIPVLTLVFSNLMIAGINQKHYGLFVVNDRSGSSEAEFISRLMEMDEKSENPNVWVSQNAMKKAVEVSPALQEIQPQIEEMFQSGWVSGGEIVGDIVVWAFRDAMEAAGYYQGNAPETEAFYKRAIAELDQAYEDGRLHKDGLLHLSALSKGISWKDVPTLVKRIKSSFLAAVNARYAEVQLKKASGNRDQIRYFEAMTGANALYPDGKTVDSEYYQTLRVAGISQKIIHIYQAVGWALFLLSAIVFGFFAYRMIGEIRKKQYEIWNLWLIVSGILLTVLIFWFIVNWFTTFLGSDIRQYDHYLLPSVLLLEIAEVLLLGKAAVMAQDWLAKCKNERK